MGRLPLAFTFDSATVEELRVQAQREKELGNLDLLVVDYLQILRTSARLQKRYEAVGHVSRALKDIALDLQVPVVAMAQVGRQTVNAGGERAPVMPDLSDLRDRANIEQDAAGHRDLSSPPHQRQRPAAFPRMTSTRAGPSKRGRDISTSWCG